MLVGYEELQKKMEDMEANYDEQFRIVFQAIIQLLKECDQPKRKIGL